VGLGDIRKAIGLVRLFSGENENIGPMGLFCQSNEFRTGITGEFM